MKAVAPLKKASSKALVTCLQALVHLGGEASEKQLSEWAGCSATTTRHAVRLLDHCSIVAYNEDGSVRLNAAISHPLSFGDGLSAIGSALSQTDSFIELAALLDAGHTANDSTRRAAMVEPSLDSAESAATLLSLSGDLGLLSQASDGSYSVSDSIEGLAVDYSGADLGVAGSQLALREVMGPEAFRALEKTERSRMGEAFQGISSNPEKACEDAGKAVENYLRLIARDAGVDVSGCNGLAQVADALAAKGSAVIRPQHRTVAHEVAMCRNSSGHDRDKHTLESWEKTPAFARANILLAARLVASIHAWRSEGRQVL